MRWKWRRSKPDASATSYAYCIRRLVRDISGYALNVHRQTSYVIDDPSTTIGRASRRLGARCKTYVDHAVRPVTSLGRLSMGDKPLIFCASARAIHINGPTLDGDPIILFWDYPKTGLINQGSPVLVVSLGEIHTYPAVPRAARSPHRG